MASIINTMFSVLGFLPILTAASALPHIDEVYPMTRRSMTTALIQTELGPRLSNTTNMYGPLSSDWANVTERYQMFRPPNIRLVVEPGLESDIPIIVKFANQNSIPFMAVNRGHALTSTVGAFTGIEISMRKLQDITILPGNKTALIQGGAYGGEILDALWGEGYIATTGSCACVGLMGASLGGGHGRYQGMYGLIADNYVNLNVVLADGRTVQVNETSHTDLWYAMRGAGHNYGIVTSVELKIHPANLETWYYKSYEFTGEYVETLFEALNTFHGNNSLPTAMAVDYGVYTVDTNVSTTEPIIYWSFGYAGPKADAVPLLAPFDAIPAVFTEDGEVPFTEMADVQGTGLSSSLCQSGKTHIIATAGLQIYNVTTQRRIYDLYVERLAANPAELGSTRIVMEDYNTQAVRAVASDSSAFPLRDDYLLMYFDATPAAESDLRPFCEQWARDTRDLWNAGQPARRPTNYVNYSFGDESLESMYGYESWRLKKLQATKLRYDPHNRFAYFNPVIPLHNSYQWQ